MMCPAINSIDHGIGRPLKLVIETAIHQSSDDRIAQGFAREHVTCRTPLNAIGAQTTMDAFDDIATLTKVRAASLQLCQQSPIG